MGLELSFSGQSACLICTKPWAPVWDVMCRCVVVALGRERQGDTKFKFILFGYRVSLKLARATEKR